jgi:hypothetical protein
MIILAVWRGRGATTLYLSSHANLKCYMIYSAGRWNGRFLGREDLAALLSFLEACG